MFANDIVLVNESRDGVNAKLKRWREPLKSKSFKISHAKTAYIYCNFSGHIQRAQTTMRIEAQEIPQRNSFYYLGSIISQDGEIDADVKRNDKSGMVEVET